MGRNTSDIQSLATSLDKSLEAATSLPIGSVVELANASPIVDDTYLLCAGGVVNKSDWPGLTDYVPPFTSASSLSSVDLQSVFPFLYPIGMEYFAGSYWMLSSYALSRSTDGRNWQVVLETDRSDLFTGVKVSGDGLKLIVVQTTCFQFSADGNAWTKCNQAVVDVDTNGSRWVMVSGTTAFYSDDLATWTACTIAATAKRGVVWFAPGSRWVVLTQQTGNQAGVFNSGTDGVTFVDSAVLNVSYPVSLCKLRRVGNYLTTSSLSLAGGANCLPYRSSDGTTWSSCAYMIIDTAYANNTYYCVAYTTDTTMTVFSGANLSALSVITTLTRVTGYATDLGTKYGRIAASPAGDIIFTDKRCLYKRISSNSTECELYPVAISEDTTVDGSHGFSSGAINGILGLHYVNFYNGTFVLNAGVTPTYRDGLSFDKVFASESVHYWCCGLDSEKKYAVAMKITIQSGQCVVTIGNQCGVASVAGASLGIKTPGPDRYVLGKCSNSTSSYDMYCSELVNNTQIAITTSANESRMSIADGRCFVGPYQLAGNAVTSLSGLAKTDHSTGTVTTLTATMETLSAVVNGSTIFSTTSYVYREGDWGETDMIPIGPGVGIYSELNQCAAGYFLMGVSRSLFSPDGYNWSIMPFAKPSSGTPAACPLSYTEGKLFMFDGVSTLNVFAAADYDPLTQIQLPNIKSGKPGINCYIKAA